MSDAQKWALMAAVPVLSFVVGVVALPRPKAVADERVAAVAGGGRAFVSQTAPKPGSPVDALLDDSVRVVGADLPKEPVSRGSSFEITFHFGVEEELDRDWQIFVHIDAKQGSYRIHGDHFPLDGKLPTTLWKKGEFVADVWRKVVPRDAPAGDYDVWTGLYVGDERMLFTGGDKTRHDGQNRIRVGTLHIE